MKRALAAAVLLLAACRAAEQQRPQPPKHYIIPPPSDDAERASLVNLAYGATIASRTGEAVLEASAVAAIDGDPVSQWLNPPHDFPQSITIALAAPSRLDRIGARTAPKPEFQAKELVFESSMDGRTFRTLATMAGDKEWIDINPIEAAFLRVTVPAPRQENGNVALYSILAHGRELAPARPGTIDGCWIVNGRRASFETRGARTLGAMEYPQHDTLYFDGAGNGRFWRFEWVRGAGFGYAAIAVSPDGLHLSGEQWHEEVVPLFFGDAWFGEPVECAGHAGALTAAAWPPHSTVADEFLKRAGRHSLYALDMSWIVEKIRQYPHVRFVAHEFREKTPAANRARAQRALDSLAKALQNAGIEPRRVTFVAAGSDDPRQIPGSEAARELYSTIDLEVGR